MLATGVLFSFLAQQAHLLTALLKEASQRLVTRVLVGGPPRAHPHVMNHFAKDATWLWGIFLLKKINNSLTKN